MKKKAIIFSFYLLAFKIAFAQPLTIQWQKCLGGSYGDQISVIRQTANNHYFLGASTISNDGDVNGNHGLSGDFWIVEIDSNGVLQQQKCFGGSGEEELSSLMLFDDHYIAVGLPGSTDGDVTGLHGASLDFWILNADTSGNLIWEVCLGGTRFEEPYEIIKSNNNCSVVIGYARSTDYDVTGLHDTISTTYSPDVWVVKIDSSGAIKWAKCYGGLYPDIGYSIVQTPDSGYIFTAGTKSNDGDVHGNHLISTDDFWIVKIDSLGIIEWEKCYGGTLDDIPRSIICTKDGGYAAIGLSMSNNYDVTSHHGSNGDEDAWLIKIDSIGNLQWEKSLGGTLYDYGAKIIQMPDSGYLALCYTNSTDDDLASNPANGTDVWMIGLDQMGNILWSQCFGGSFGDAAYDMELTADGGLIFGGITFSNDGDVSGNHGNGDAWVVKLAPLPDEIASSKISVTDFSASLSCTNLQISFYSNKTTKSQIQLYDLAGRLLLTKHANFITGLNQLVIPVALPQGMYFVKVDNAVEKVIASH